MNEMSNAFAATLSQMREGYASQELSEKLQELVASRGGVEATL